MRIEGETNVAGTLLPVVVPAALVGVAVCTLLGINVLASTKSGTPTDPGNLVARLTKPGHYDPNNDARNDYREAWRTVIYVPAKLDDMRIRRGYPTHWSQADCESVQNWVEANAEALGYIARGANKLYYWPDYGSKAPVTMIVAPPEAVEVRSLASALNARIKLHAWRGEHDQMLSDVTTLWRFSRHFQGKKPASYQVIGLALQGMAFQTVRRVLAHETLPPSMLLSLQRLFRDFADADEPAYFDLEPILWRDGINLLFTNEEDGQRRISIATIEKLEKLPASARFLPEVTTQQKEAFRTLDRRETMESMQEFFKLTTVAARMTPSEFYGTPNRVRAGLESIVDKNAFIAWLSEWPPALQDVPWRVKTDRAALVTILASIRYKMDRGQYPESLEELVKAAYLDHMPRDYFSKDATLIYKRTDSGFLLYSRGLDFADNGGTPSRWGQGPKGGDQVFWPVAEDD